MKALLVCLTCNVLALGLFSGSASAQTAVNFSADANGQITFTVPSLNVGCTYTPAGGTRVYTPADGGPELSCDHTKPRYTRAVLTPKTVRRFDRVSDQDGFADVNAIKAGSRWTQGPFTCDATAAALTCKRADGRGFVIDRGGIKTN